MALMLMCLMGIAFFSEGNINSHRWEGERILDNFNGKYLKGYGEGLYGMTG